MSDIGMLKGIEQEVIMALTTPAIPFSTSVYISDASNTSPIVVTTTTLHMATTGNSVTISGVTGNTAANGTFVVTVITPNTFSLNSSIGNALYIAGGTVTVSTTIDVIPSMSLNDLINKDSLRSTAIGVLFLGTTNITEYAIGVRRLRATTKWRVAVSVTNLRGSQYARQDAYSILENIRDQLHFYTSAYIPKAKFLLQEEQTPNDQPEGKIVAWADYSLDVILGN